MKKFDFKLEPLLEYRQRLEDILRKDLAEAGRLLDIEEAKFTALRKKHQDSTAEVERLKGEDNNSEDLLLYYNYLVGLKGHMEEQTLMVAKFRKKYEDQRRKLVKSAQERKTVEMVKERAQNLHELEENREDQKITDDIATTRFIRRASIEEG
jgi:flagellar FliJ protein